jgi:hypothetical protein
MSGDRQQAPRFCAWPSNSLAQSEYANQTATCACRHAFDRYRLTFKRCMTIEGVRRNRESGTHLMAETFKQEVGVDVTHVPYKGGCAVNTPRSWPAKSTRNSTASVRPRSLWMATT